MTWLIIARSVQGIGGGGTYPRFNGKFMLKRCTGILQMVNIVIGDIVPLAKSAYSNTLILPHTY